MHSISFSCGIVTIFAVRVRIARAVEGCATHHNSPLIEAEVCVFEGYFFFRGIWNASLQASWNFCKWSRWRDAYGYFAQLLVLREITCELKTEMLFHQKRIMLRETLRVPKASTVERVTDYDDGAGDDAMYSTSREVAHSGWLAISDFLGNKMCFT